MVKEKFMFLILMIGVLSLVTISAGEFGYNLLETSTITFNNATGSVNNSLYCGGVLCEDYLLLDGSNTPWTGDMNAGGNNISNVNRLTADTANINIFETSSGTPWNMYNGGDLVLNVTAIGGNNFFEIATQGAFFQLYANPNPSIDNLLATITETQGSTTEINFYEGGVGRNRFWDSGSARFGGPAGSDCDALTEEVDCDTPGTGADIVVEDDGWFGGKIISTEARLGQLNFTTNEISSDTGVINFNEDTLNGSGNLNFSKLTLTNGVGQSIISEPNIFGPSMQITANNFIDIRALGNGLWQFNGIDTVVQSPSTALSGTSQTYISGDTAITTNNVIMTSNIKAVDSSIRTTVTQKVVSTGIWGTNVNDAPSRWELYTQSAGSGNALGTPRFTIDDVGLANFFGETRFIDDAHIFGDEVKLFYGASNDVSSWFNGTSSTWLDTVEVGSVTRLFEGFVETIFDHKVTATEFEGDGHGLSNITKPYMKIQETPGLTQVDGTNRVVNCGTDVIVNSNYNSTVNQTTLVQSGIYQISYTMIVDEDSTLGDPRGRIDNFMTLSDGTYIPGSNSSTYTREATGGTGNSNTYLFNNTGGLTVELHVVTTGFGVVDDSVGSCQISITKMI